MLAAEQGRVEEEKPKVDDAEETAPIDPAEFTAKRKALEASVKKQGDLVCKLKADGKDAKTDAELQAAISELRQQKEELKTLIKSYTKQFASEKADIDREAVEDLLKRRFFYTPSFEIYNGVKGLYDLGPPGCAVQAALVNHWRQTFVNGEDLMELDCSVLTPKTVLDVSGHTEKFCDFLVTRKADEEPMRADHLLEEWIDARLADEANPLTADEEEALRVERGQADAFNKEQLLDALRRNFRPAPVVKSKKNKKKGADNSKKVTYDDEWTEPREFNMMFGTPIGPGGHTPGFLRPETAQGMFVNFRRLLDYSGGKLPFGAAQIGKAFRNEINPCQGLLRVREFWLAEIEYFVHPKRSDHIRFNEIASCPVRLFPIDSQLGSRVVLETTFGEAVEKNVISSKCLAYFMARTWQFLEKVGIESKWLRMRQHLPSEMAHYARDCWDAEILTSYGWVEVVGHADRSAYDLEAHTKGSSVRLDVYETWSENDWQTVRQIEMKPNPGLMGKTLRKRTQATMTKLKAIAEDRDAALALEKQLASDGKAPLDIDDGEEAITLERDMVSFKEIDVVIKGEVIQPYVIEPAFGIGRILYAIFEHRFRKRDVQKDTEKRNFLALPAIVAPVKFSILPLITSSEVERALCQEIRTQLHSIGISTKIDMGSENIGRRYARTDEIGIPFGVTVDTISETDRTVTLRERDSCAQVRLSIDGDLFKNVATALINGDAWSDVVEQFKLQAYVHESN